MWGYMGLAALIFIGLILGMAFLGGDRFIGTLRAEQRGDYKSACYGYATAILNGSSRSKEARKRIKQLWETHGPFDYTETLKKGIAEQGGSNTEDCAKAGHALIMAILSEAAGDSFLKKRPS